MTILEEIAEYTKARIEKEKKQISTNELRTLAEKMNENEGFVFEDAIRNSDNMAFICECKKASPSKGIIANEFPYVDIALEYEAAGADAISVLTEPKWFLGSNSYLEEISMTVKIPCLRKDFTIDPFMIYEAQVIGAKAILLICSLLDTKTLNEYIQIALL